MTKLTLSVNEDVTRAAKRYAAAKRTTVSQIVSNLFRSLAPPKNGRIGVHGPLTRRLLGIAPKGRKERRPAKSLLAEALTAKHLAKTDR